jgi:ribosomal-protein-alanine N-acetyltransferase
MGRSEGLSSKTPLGPGARAFLARPCAEDEAEYLALLQSSASFHEKWFPARSDSAFEAPAFQAFLSSDDGQRCVRHFIRRKKDGTIVGVVNLNEIVRGVFESAFLGYWVGADFQGQGYMKQGLSLVLDFAFGQLGLHRLEANIMPENTASLALVQALGFQREGFSPSYLKIAGQWRDHERWAIIRESD